MFIYLYICMHVYRYKENFGNKLCLLHRRFDISLLQF